jgi:hypothetical protein
MRFYNQQHQYYCGIDLHARSIYICKKNHEGVAERFKDASVQKNIEIDLELIAYYGEILPSLEWYILKTAKSHDARTFSIPLGICTNLNLHGITQFIEKSFAIFPS